MGTGTGEDDGGLNHIENADCAGGQVRSDVDCYQAADWAWKLWTQPETAKQYYGRGAFQLAGNYNYARLSAVLYEGYDSANILLEDPDKVATDGYLGFASALYIYQNAEHNKPSMHDVITGHYVPNQAEKDAGDKGKKDSAIKRIGYYNHFLTELGLDANKKASLQDSMQCKDEGDFTQTTAGVHFARDWVNDKRCKLVTY